MRNLAKWQALGTRPGMASPAQLALIDTIWDELAWYWNADGTGDRLKALHGFLARTCRGVETMRFVSFEEAGRVIEAMKAIASRKPGEVKREA